MSYLARVMNHVASDYRLDAIGGNVHADMARRMTRRGFQLNFSANLMIRRHQLRQTRSKYRLYRIFYNWSVFLLFGAPVSPLLFGK